MARSRRRHKVRSAVFRKDQRSSGSIIASTMTSHRDSCESQSASAVAWADCRRQVPPNVMIVSTIQAAPLTSRLDHSGYVHRAFSTSAPKWRVANRLVRPGCRAASGVIEAHPADAKGSRACHPLKSRFRLVRLCFLGNEQYAHSRWVPFVTRFELAHNTSDFERVLQARAGMCRVGPRRFGHAESRQQPGEAFRLLARISTDRNVDVD